ncbi:MAG TPA: hypothetical protein VHF87_02795 [Methylomirabilota bacterium]|nr:hypothetical protein [Methylomirabilota bacterium]
MTLRSSAVARARGLVRLRSDWTRRDAQITRGLTPSAGTACRLVKYP